MRTDTRLASVVFVALATFALSGCGAGDSNPPSTSPSPGATHNNAALSATIAPAGGIPNASAPLAAGPAAASDAITQIMQASLAADSQQVAPVMHYAPGDNANSN
ncbi:hypothetical protein [Paraburkholderia haematera]|uniref:Lipoprotein n=1 Tax=Paraburkholderia haematera TaxID=2793077 RepID=A0ABN7LY62_9BURK|nr:hypothetical protein [Paraburkholderia haematera]CAE6766854.1 hypothetical protein R69888_03679 [Paraburkholderia haematera]